LIPARRAGGCCAAIKQNIIPRTVSSIHFAFRSISQELPDVDRKALRDRCGLQSGVCIRHPGAEPMNFRSPWLAAGVVLGTVLVCFLGVRAELAQARRSDVQRTQHLAAPATADLNCRANSTKGC
jgi:hypothetical protein